MDIDNSNGGRGDMLESAVYDFLERQPIEGHTFQLVQSESAKMRYILVDRFFSAYRVNGLNDTFCITGFADDGNRYIGTYGDSLEEVYANLSSMVPVMNLAPESDGRLVNRKDGLLNDSFLDFEYTFRNVVCNVEAYRQSVFEGMTCGKPAVEPLESADASIDRQIRKFAEMSGSRLLVDEPEAGRYTVRSPEKIDIVYEIYGNCMTIRSQLDDVTGRAEAAGISPFDLYVGIQAPLTFSPAYADGRILYVSRDIGEDSPMRECIMEQSFDCLEAHDAYRLRLLDL